MTGTGKVASERAARDQRKKLPIKESKGTPMPHKRGPNSISKSITQWLAVIGEKRLRSACFSEQSVLDRTPYINRKLN